MTDKLTLRELLTKMFDVARAEGMLRSKDGKHSESSDSDTEDFISAVWEAVKGSKLINIPQDAPFWNTIESTIIGGAELQLAATLKALGMEGK